MWIKFIASCPPVNPNSSNWSYFKAHYSMNWIADSQIFRLWPESLSLWCLATFVCVCLPYVLFTFQGNLLFTQPVLPNNSARSIIWPVQRYTVKVFECTILDIGKGWSFDERGTQTHAASVANCHCPSRFLFTNVCCPTCVHFRSVPRLPVHSWTRCKIKEHGWMRRIDSEKLANSS